MIIWQEMYKGMGAAGWAIGFLMILGLALIALGCVGWAVLKLLESDAEQQEVTGDADSDPFGDTYEDAPRVGRHVGKGA